VNPAPSARVTRVPRLNRGSRIPHHHLDELWELADLTASRVNLKGNTPSNTERLGFTEWAEMIGWLERGYTLSYMKDIIAEARTTTWMRPPLGSSSPPPQTPVR